MRIVFIQPPIEDFYSTPIRLQPIGLAYLSGVLKKHFPEVDVIVKDFQQGWGKRSIPLPEALRFLKDYYCFPDRSPFSTFYHYYRFGASEEQVLKEVEALNPDLVGISMLFTAYAPQALQLARILKKSLNVPILLGGSDVSARANELLALPFVDFVIRGEGERPVVRFVEEWLGKRRFDKVPNLGFKTADEKLVFNDLQDNFTIDELPFPDFAGLNLDHYRLGRRKLSFLISSRGCPYRCAFCSVQQTFGHRLRLRSVENILQEMDLRLAAGVRAFDFEDDNLTLDQRRFKTLCKEIIKNYAAYDLKLLAMNGLAYFKLDARTLELMKDAGFGELNISLVSLNQPVLKQLKRPFNLQKFEQVVQNAQALGMSVISYQILGLPGESVDSMLQTLIYLSRLPLRIGVSPFYLTPGMPLEGSLPERNKAWWVVGRLSSLSATENEARRQRIFTLFVMARMVNFLKGLDLYGKSLLLDEILAERNHWQGRDLTGLEILFKLLTENRFYVFDGNEFRLHPAFDVDIFKKFMEEVKWIKRLDGGTISV
ncbi:B12-binding domain-containing radical SAM protein [Calditrichota bacterium LG25]